MSKIRQILLSIDNLRKLTENSSQLTCPENSSHLACTDNSSQLVY